MNISDMKLKLQNNNDSGYSSIRRRTELVNLAPQTGFLRKSPNGDVPSVTNSSSNNSNPAKYGRRETGFVEKLLHSYGFVQCHNRQARLFFHFSQFKGDSDSLKHGDILEFEEACDHFTNKPVAVSLTRQPSIKKSGEIMSENAVIGTVLTEAKASRPNCGDGEMTGSQDGSVSYEQSGEMFFLAYAVEDVEGGQRLQAGDQVEFFISTDERNSNLRARKIRKAGVALSGQVYQGVVCSLKENFGFIERSDVVREIFFHYSEYKGDIGNLNLGDDVEFSIQSRNNKEVAVSVKSLPVGTVVFEDISPDPQKGRIIKLPKQGHGRRQSEIMSGRIAYESGRCSTEIVFGDDAVYDYTLMEGDLVEFLIASDRRDRLQHAINIELLEETFPVNHERREKGFITTLKEAFGFIRCTDREARMFFHFSELLNPKRPPLTQDEVEFTVIQDPTNETRQIAIRIRYLAKGTIAVDKCAAEKFTGIVEKESGTQRNYGQDMNPGIVMYDFNNMKQTIPYSSSAVDGNLPKLGDKVEFQISECAKTMTRTAVNVRVTGRSNVNKECGYVVTLKESFGFIETIDHEKEIFFHYSAYDGDIADFELGDEVEFTISQKNGKISAENLRRIIRGRLPTEVKEDVQPDVMEGRIFKTLSVASSDQSEYSGVIQLESKDGDVIDVTYPYGIMSLVDKRDMPQKGELVRFQVAVTRDSGKKRAVKVAPVRRYVQSRIESLAAESGTLNYDKDDGRLPFQLADAQDSSELCVGDDVEFVVVQNLHGSRAAFNVRKTCEKPRPERLIARMKSVSEEGRKVMVIRQPRGPDGTRGFKIPRTGSTGKPPNSV